MKRTIKIGVFGGYRGSAFYNILLMNNAEIVAICDKNPHRIEQAKEKLGNDVAVYEDFDAFIEHEGMEAVFLCNYFNEHAPYAIRALEKGIHVLSECTSNGTMAEGVALVRAAEKSKAIYMLSENYPFMKFNKEMHRVFQGGTLGKLYFAEGEYNHPGDLTNFVSTKKLVPYAKHWRNWLPRSYYITHSLAPLMHITGAWPRRVTAFAVNDPYPEESLCNIRSGDRVAVVMTQNDDGSVFRVTGCASFGAHENSYRICGSKGQIENIRGEKDKVLLRYNEWDLPEGAEKNMMYTPSWNDPDAKLIDKGGHGGGDFLVIREFLDAIREERKPVFDVYFATTMASVAILSHRSILNGGAPYDIPDFRKEEDRVKYENDHETPFWGPNGEAPTVRAGSLPDQEWITEEDLAVHDARLAEIET